jgi:hypothetical protein
MVGARPSFYPIGYITTSCSHENWFGVQPSGWGDESTLKREHPTLFIAFWVAQRAMNGFS